MTSRVHPAPPDQAQRDRALDPARSIIVQAPAGSGKTDLLTKRFLRLLTEVDDPSQVVVRSRLQKRPPRRCDTAFKRAGESSRAGSRHVDADRVSPWSRSPPEHASTHSRNGVESLLEVPGQLRISTIDSFCREIAIQRPLPHHAWRKPRRQRRAHRTVSPGGAQARSMQLGRGAIRMAAQTRYGESIETLLLWRDNNWQELGGPS